MCYKRRETETKEEEEVWVKSREPNRPKAGSVCPAPDSHLTPLTRSRRAAGGVCF